MKTTKYIVTSQKNLKAKYGSKFSKIEALLARLVDSDKKKDLQTKVLYIDNSASAARAGITAVTSITASSCKRAIDQLYERAAPEYIAILGAQDIIPFQKINNPAEDDDDEITIDSDLPYACDSPYGKDIAAFTGPTRVVGRIPDVPGLGDPNYLSKIISNIINHKSIDLNYYRKYFSVSAKIWHKSTKLSLNNMFGENEGLLLSPVHAPLSGYKRSALKPLTHFINCHGASQDFHYYGQQGKNNFPIALSSRHLMKNVGYGTIVAAECCYGAELIDPTVHDKDINGKWKLSIANAYLYNDAITFLGSSTIAYGPADSQGLADLITQYFIKNIMAGMSTGSALLDARQRFISISGPDLDPFELKTLAQFYMLGDPSVRPVLPEEITKRDAKVGNSTRNHRKRMMMKGISLKNDSAPSKKIADKSRLQSKASIKKLLKDVKLSRIDRVMTFQSDQPSGITNLQKKLIGNGAKFHTFIQFDKTLLNTNGNGKDPAAKGSRKRKTSSAINRNYVLVVKEDQQEILGWRVYVGK